MRLLEIERPSRKLIPDPIVATKVEREVQEAFDHLAERVKNIEQKIYSLRAKLNMSPSNTIKPICN